SLSNQFGYLVLTTGNKSETAVGYSTLYGDTAGGFAVIKDVPKTIVYKLSDYVNKLHAREVIPQSIIDRIPSAELRFNQKDSDSLPEYEILDGILKAYVEEEKSLPEIINKGYDPAIVAKVIAMVDRNEYKRRQCPPGVKITPKAFGRDRRMPMTNLYRQRINNNI
ncbi:MAG: NAD(+) synthase, partial [Phycisphaerales bacterium]